MVHWAGKQQFANRFCAVNQVLPIYLHIRYLCQPPAMKAFTTKDTNSHEGNRCHQSPS
jgi:hypothetical protein